MDTTDTAGIAAIAWLGHERIDKFAEQLDRAGRALRLGMPELELYSLLAPNFDNDAPAVVAARRWAERDSGTFVLAGPVGTGKSLGAALWAVVTGARWAICSEVASWSHAEAGVRMQAWIDAPALVLDELGGHGSSSSLEVTRLATVIAKRHSKLRRTVITTNLRRRDFAELLDGTREQASRLVDRIVENGEWLDVKGASRRAEPADHRAGKVRYAGMLRLRQLVEAADAVVIGSPDDTGPVEALARVLQVTPKDLSRAHVALAARAARIDELAQELFDKWQAEQIELAEDEGMRALHVSGPLSTYLAGGER